MFWASLGWLMSSLLCVSSLMIFSWLVPRRRDRASLMVVIGAWAEIGTGTWDWGTENFCVKVHVNM